MAKTILRANVQETFIVPRSLDSSQRELLSDLIIDEIIHRTEVKKIDKNSNKLKEKPYSESYINSFDFKLAGKGKNPNLTLTGEMLNSMELISHESGRIIIGYDPKEEIAKRVEGNQIGSYGQPNGNPAKARPFLGLPKKVLKRLIHKVESKTISNNIKKNKSLIDELFGNVFVDRESDLRLEDE